MSTAAENCTLVAVEDCTLPNCCPRARSHRTHSGSSTGYVRTRGNSVSFIGARPRALTTALRGQAVDVEVLPAVGTTAHVRNDHPPPRQDPEPGADQGPGSPSSRQAMAASTADLAFRLETWSAPFDHV